MAGQCYDGGCFPEGNDVSRMRPCAALRADGVPFHHRGGQGRGRALYLPCLSIGGGKRRRGDRDPEPLSGSCGGLARPGEIGGKPNYHSDRSNSQRCWPYSGALPASWSGCGWPSNSRGPSLTSIWPRSIRPVRSCAVSASTRFGARLVPLHGAFDGLSERTALHLSAETRRWSTQPALALNAGSLRCRNLTGVGGRADPGPTADVRDCVTPPISVEVADPL